MRLTVYQVLITSITDDSGVNFPAYCQSEDGGKQRTKNRISSWIPSQLFLGRIRLPRSPATANSEPNRRWPAGLHTMVHYGHYRYHPRSYGRDWSLLPNTGPNISSQDWRLTARVCWRERKKTFLWYIVIVNSARAQISCLPWRRFHMWSNKEKSMGESVPEAPRLRTCQKPSQGLSLFCFSQFLFFSLCLFQGHQEQDAEELYV